MGPGRIEGETMREKRLDELLEALPTSWLENYVEMFEAGRVQRHPRARFVTEKGECCLVAAMSASTSRTEFVGSEQWSMLLGTELEELSRRFETRRLTAQRVYEEALLVLAHRRGETSSEAVEPVEVAALDAAIALSA
ncbi:MAG: hypothetical protein ACODAE_08830 [Gemmatimonadota bacterium]